VLRAGFVLALALLPCAARGLDNDGLGPLSVRNLFPPALPFLSHVPEATMGLPPGTVSLTYQYAVANTYINTQFAGLGVTPVIGAAEVARGLTAADFPALGYGAYIDVEAAVHTVRLRYGLSRSLELGLDQSWVGFGGGSMDGAIEQVERSVGGLNRQRLDVPRNQYQYFLAKDGKLLAASTGSFDGVPQDPVLSVKWIWSGGGAVLPAAALKLAYKAPLDAATTAPRSLVSSGRADSGYHLLLAKGVGNVVAHFQLGETLLSQKGSDYADSIQHKLFALEFRRDSRNSWLLQMATQTSIFRGSPDSRRNDFAMTRATDLLVLGHKFQGRQAAFDWGLVEDINSTANSTDVVVFFNLGWRW
jgi:hypothetical protein